MHNPRTVAGLILQTAERVPHAPAIVAVDGSFLDYAELVRSGRRLGNALLGLGLEPGGRIAAWLEDSVEYVQLYVACALAGFVIVPINARYTEHEAGQLLDDSGARFLAHSPGLDDRVAALAEREHPLTVIRSGDGVRGRTSFTELIAGGSDAVHPTPGPDDLYMIGYTSGTTGTPKGAMLTQGSVATLARMNALSYRLTQGSVAAMTGSMSFVAVVPSHIISHFYVGGSARLLGKWDVDSLIDTIERHRVTFTYLPSPVLSDFAAVAAAAPQRWSSLLSVLHSASKAPLSKLREVADVIGDRLIEGWGMTENSGGLVTVTSPGDVLIVPGQRDRLSSIGRAVQEMRVRVIDPDGLDLVPNGETVGELIVSSPSLMVGYWNKPDATATALRDGWYHSGDLGAIDESGYVYLSERRVDLIVSGGMNVYPSEVEECILRVPGVTACAVVGLPHARWGQSVAAAVVIKPGSGVTEELILDTCRQFLAGYKKPTRITFVESLPMTASMKVSRLLVREAMADGAP